MANVWHALGLTSGTKPLADYAIAGLSHGDRAWAIDESTGILYPYWFDSSATDATSSPDYIRPTDYATVGAGVWKRGLSATDSVYSVPSGIDVTGGIFGGEISGISGTDVTISPFYCKYDSTMSTDFGTASSTVVDLSGYSTGDIVSIFAVEETSGGAITCYADTDETGASLSGVDYFRWLTFARRLGTGIVGVTQNGDYMNFWVASENTLSSSISTSYATVDHSLLIPTDKIELIEYGQQGNSIIASDDGTNVSLYLGGSASAPADTNKNAWYYNNKHGLAPFNSSRQFATTTGTGKLLCQQVKLKR